MDDMTQTKKIEDLASRLAESLEQMTALRRVRMRTDIGGLDLTMPQIRTLSFLSQGPKKMKDISENLGRGMPSATSMIDRLVKKQYVVRTEDPSDRRVVVCELTTTGKTTLDQFARIGQERSEELAASMSQEELELVVPAIGVLVQAMARQAGMSPEEADQTIKARWAGGRRL